MPAMDCTLIKLFVTRGSLDVGFKVTCVPEGVKAIYYTDLGCQNAASDLGTYGPSACVRGV